MRLVTFLPDMHVELQTAFAGASRIELVVTGDEDRFAQALPGAQAAALYSGSFNADLAAAFAGAPGLGWVQAGSTGFDRLLQFGVPDGVRLSTAGALWAGTVAEHALALILGLLRQLPLAEAQKTHGAWDRERIRNAVSVLEGARVAIIGMGAIGQAIAARVRAFGAEVVAVVRDPSSAPDKIYASSSLVTDMTGLRQHLGQVDIVLPAVPLNRNTTGLIDAGFMAGMKPGSLLINISRGPVVVEGALIEALTTGHLGGAGLDVFDVEPLPADSPLWSQDNIILTPHVGGFGDPRRLSILAQLIRDNAERFRSGAPLLNEVDRPTHTVRTEMLTETSS
ncbi:MAG: D-2-hydroxyacid dehydrogenase [Minwuia sp.]|nr:D-2-hydroxyacid dehydrogenase [Minwuia sp.]